MADAKVIPFDDDRSRSGGGSRPARRRTGAGGRGDGSTAPVSALPGGRLPEPAPEGGAGEQEPQQPQEAQEPPEPSASPESSAGADGGWERRIAGGLAFLRRRVTGDYEVDEFGYD
ncbi:glycerol acyltransferase, partial [Streptomyces sp. DSM 41770]|nr:glycerol acyltransferase [Streptomyces sp. DSM 41770]